MKSIMKIVGTVFLLTIINMSGSQTIMAQQSGSYGWKINLNGGPSLFFGDIKQYRIWPVTNDENEWRLAGGLTLSKQLSPVFDLRGQGIYGQLSGTRRAWDRFFETNYFEFNLNTVVNVNNLFGTPRNDRFVTFYLTAGIGLMNYNTTLYTLSTKKKVGGEGNGNGKSFGGRTLEGILMGGFGLDFRLNDSWSVNLETANRIMNSDALDTKISMFPYDVYNYTAIGVTYRFGASKSSRGISPSTYQRTAPQEQYIAEPKQKEPVQKETVTYENKPVEVPTPVTAPKKKPVEVVTPPVKKESKVVVVHKRPVQSVLKYSVQIRARYNRPLKISYLSAKYNIPASDIRENRHSGYYIYTVGSYDTYEEARAERNRLRNYNGATDAFVVAFKNGQRLNKLP